MKKITSGLVLIMLALIAGCSSSPYRNTRIVDVRPNLEKPAHPPYQRPVVAVLIDSPNRATIERAVVRQLQDHGINAREALPIYGNTGTEGQSNAYIADQLRQHGFDSAVGIHLIDKKVENVEVAGGPSAPAPSAASFSMKAEPLGPDFSLDETTYVVRVNFFDTRQQATVWSATSITQNPDGVLKGSDQFANTIVKQLTEAGLFNR